ncbi:hypothetical protein K435DRAFT_809282 [Dendrothele bispora CBS 962.96]|uniref:Secreted protein n=1 Tax=Dendrothele bispora (strain CBS 962.96) TaxID=1314807 RepID=A0A4S8KYS0_DENBC|nr:hypothetical protein K435DRAFT_809282 [Dendrothele bispora CBS 962.96]
MPWRARQASFLFFFLFFLIRSALLPSQAAGPALSSPWLPGLVRVGRFPIRYTFRCNLTLRILKHLNSVTGDIDYGRRSSAVKPCRRNRTCDPDEEDNPFQVRSDRKRTTRASGSTSSERPFEMTSEKRKSGGMNCGDEFHLAFEEGKGWPDGSLGM